MRAIVTGVAGFIGSHVAEDLVAQGNTIVGIDDLSGGRRENVPSGVEFHQRDCCQPLDDLFERYRPEVVYHLAAYAAEGLSHHIPNYNYANNVIGTTNVLSAAQRSGVRHFVFTSSIAAYGHPPDDQPLDESTSCHPCDPYGIAKLACEQHIAAFFDYFGGPAFTIFRPHNVFGPRQNISDPYRNVVGIFFRCAKQGVSLPVFGDGSQTRRFSYIDSVAQCIAMAPTVDAARNETFNVGGDESLSVLELATAIIKLTGARSKLEFLPPRKEVQHAHAKHGRSHRVFPEAYAGAISLDAGLERMAHHVASLTIPPPTPCPSAIEIDDGLPPSWRA